MEYQVIKSRRRTIGMEMSDRGLIVRTPLFCTSHQIEKFVNDHEAWIKKHEKKLENRKEYISNLSPITESEIKKLRKDAKIYIPDRVKYYSEIMGLKYNEVSIKFLKSRWGSCSAKKNLNFNLLLMLTPKEVIDSVVVHELAHLKEMNHKDSFYKLVLKHCPNYYEYDKWLRKNGQEILLRAKKGME